MPVNCGQCPTVAASLHTENVRERIKLLEVGVDQVRERIKLLEVGVDQIALELLISV
jgi:hypothetical protein